MIMKTYILPFLVLFLLFAASCSSSKNGSTDSSIDPVVDDGSNDGSSNNQWLIPISQVRDGGPGRDGIPSIDNPKFTTESEASGLLSDEVRVVGLKIGDQVRVYPHYILDWHEIINDVINSETVAITYCPLTGSAIGWNRRINGAVTTFGVSGLLYNNNVIPFDRSTSSNWSQLALQCVNGALIGERPESYDLVETNWFKLRSMFPDAQILSIDTGFDRDYGTYPYGDYRTNHDNLIFPISRDDNRLPRKERVHALIGDDGAKVYQFSSFSSGRAVKDTFQSKDILIVGGLETIISFELDEDFADLTFSYDFNDSETYFTDNEGNAYNVFGEVILGPRSGAKLKAANSFIAYWFSIGAFYPDTEIFEN